MDLLEGLPITVKVRGNWDDCVLEALDGVYGLKILKKYNFAPNSVFLMERLDTRHIDWLRSLPLLDKIEVDGLRFLLVITT